MIDQLLQGAILGLSGLAVLLASRTDRLARWGWLCGLASQPLWLWTTWHAAQWGMFLLAIVYTWGWGQGVWNHWRPVSRRGHP